MEVEITLQTSEFLESLSEKNYSKAIKLTDLLEKFGSSLRMPYSKNISKNVFELRALGKCSVRLIYTFKNNRAMVFYGFVKRSNKICRRDFLRIVKIFNNL